MPKQGFAHVPQRNKLMSENPPSLVDLCVQTAIDNVRYLGDVGETDIHLLERILPHCTVDQLMHVENATKERDLSQATNKLWKRYYEVKFGDEHTNEVIERLRRTPQKFTWKQLYEAKLEAQDLAQKESLDRLRERYKKEDERRQSRQIQVCSKAPPGKKRFYTGVGSSGGYGSWNSSVSHVKSNIMKKAKIEYLNSQETKIRAFIKKNPAQRSHVVSSTSKPVISPYKPGLSQCKPGSSQFRDSSSTRRDLKSQGTTESKQSSLQFKGSASTSSSASASASRSMQTDRENGIRRNPATSKGKATSLPPKNSPVAPRTTTKMDWDDDIKKKLSEFW